MNSLQKTVSRQITIGFLLGCFFLAAFLWFLAYTQERVDAFAEFDPVGAYLEN